MALSPPSPHRLPVLTEVIDVDDAGGRRPDATPTPPLAGAVTEPVTAWEPGHFGSVSGSSALNAASGVTDGVGIPGLAIDRPSLPAVLPLPLPEVDENGVVERVLLDLQRQVDLMLEQRMRETLAPALARLTDAMVREVRGELSGTLREIVQRAVALELARLRRG